MSDRFEHRQQIATPDNRYRYALVIDFEPSPSRRVGFIGLNPSTADDQSDDPTMRRCKRFAQAWIYPGLVMCNLFGLRATDPADLLDAADPIGRNTPDFVQQIAQQFHVTTWVACWGSHGHLFDQAARFCHQWPGPLYCLGYTKDGHPRHPLYLRRDAALRHFDASVYAGAIEA